MDGETERIIASLRSELLVLSGRVSTLEEHVDMLQTPAWKRFVYWLNGWPFLPIAVRARDQRWRFWHRWGWRRDGRRSQDWRRVP